MAYDPTAYPAVAVTVDLVVLTIRDDRLCALAVRRGESPYRGRWALPGGFVMPCLLPVITMADGGSAGARA